MQGSGSKNKEQQIILKDIYIIESTRLGDCLMGRLKREVKNYLRFLVCLAVPLLRGGSSDEREL